VKNLKTVGLVGPVGSGKTQFAELLYLTLADLSSHGKFEGILNIPVTVNILEFVDDLLNHGLGPSKTDVSKELLEAHIEISFKDWIARRRTFKISIADISGENYTSLMTGIIRDSYYDRDGLQKFMTTYGITMVDFKTIVNVILDSSVFVLLANMEHVIGLKQPQENTPPPDSALSTFLGALAAYKRKIKDSPSPKAIAIVLTHYDGAVKNALRTKGVSFEASTRENDIENYVNRELPLTSAQLRPLKSAWNMRVNYFYSGCEPELDKNGEAVFEGPRQRFRIDASTKRPEYSADEFERLANWLKSFLT